MLHFKFDDGSIAAFFQSDLQRNIVWDLLQVVQGKDLDAPASIALELCDLPTSLRKLKSEGHEIYVTFREHTQVGERLLVRAEERVAAKHPA